MDKQEIIEGRVRDACKMLRQLCKKNDCLRPDALVTDSYRIEFEIPRLMFEPSEWDALGFVQYVIGQWKTQTEDEGIRELTLVDIDYGLLDDGDKNQVRCWVWLACSVPDNVD